ncbi:hypothetical protein [Patulibacter minatonensis]|uniref:hypothetical protein n=1 Tax=Patulibacter minatonensis TaxID=298163 RepID=UPI00047E9F82|nr:hypothetical protein [Patulibacter minatonensis]
MSHVPKRRTSGRILASTAVLAAVFAVPAVASADVERTTVLTPADGTVFEGADASSVLGGSGVGTGSTRVTGIAPGAADGDEVDLVCAITVYGESQLTPLKGKPVTIEDGAFSATTDGLPPYTCRVLAIPAGLPYRDGLTPAQQAAFTGPRVLGGVHVDSDDLPGSPPGVSVTYRGQGRGLAFYAGLAFPFVSGAGGMIQSYVVDDTDYRAVFFGTGTIGTFGGLAGRGVARAASAIDIEDAPLVVDGRPAAPAPVDGDESASVVSHSVDTTTGDMTTVESAPVLFAEATRLRARDAATTGVTIRRTTVQDHDGRQTTFRDTFESTDGAAHSIEVRYGEGTIPASSVPGSGGVEQTVPATFRIPWTSGESFVEPAAGDPIAAAPAGPATIYLHAPQYAPISSDRATSRAAGERVSARADADGAGPEGAYTFDAAPTDGRFLGDGQFVVRFVRDIPAGGSTAIRHVYSQDATRAGVDELVADALGRTPVPPPADPLPATTPLPTQPAPVSPSSSPFFDPTLRLANAARGLLLKPRLGRHLRDGRKTRVVVSGLPAGRYTVAIRRYEKNGRTLASGAITHPKGGTVKVPVDLSRYGKEYFALKRIRTRSDVKVRVEVKFTAPGQKTIKRKNIRLLRFR